MQKEEKTMSMYTTVYYNTETCGQSFKLNIKTYSLVNSKLVRLKIIIYILFVL